MIATTLTPQGPIAIIVSAAPPLAPVEGMVWFDETTLRLYVRYDGTWVEVVNGYNGQDAPNKTKRYASDSASPLIYYTGQALAGTADSDSGWAIQRTTLTNSGLVFAKATDTGVWNNRESLTYT